MAPLSACLDELSTVVYAKGRLAFSLVAEYLVVCRSMGDLSRACAPKEPKRELDWLARSLELGTLVAQDGEDGVAKVYSLLSRAQAVAVVNELQAVALRKLDASGKRG